ncbi:MAG: hypothetical protein U0667_15595 [Chloroflexota bacterium]
MALTHQMTQRPCHACPAIAVDIRGGHARWQVALDDAQRDGRGAKRGDGVRIVLLHGAHHQRVHPAGMERPQVGGVERRVALGVHHQQRVAVRAKDRLGPRRDIGDEVVGQVVRDEPHLARRAPPEALGQDVRLVVEVGGGAQDPLAEVGAHVGAARQDARDRGVGHARPGGDVADADPATRSGWPLVSGHDPKYPSGADP